MTVKDLNDRIAWWEAKINEVKLRFQDKRPEEEILGGDEEILQEIEDLFPEGESLEPTPENPTGYLVNLHLQTETEGFVQDAERYQYTASAYKIYPKFAGFSERFLINPAKFF